MWAMTFILSRGRGSATAVGLGAFGVAPRLALPADPVGPLSAVSVPLWFWKGVPEELAAEALGPGVGCERVSNRGSSPTSGSTVRMSGRFSALAVLARSSTGTWMTTWYPTSVGSLLVSTESGLASGTSSHRRYSTSH